MQSEREASRFLVDNRAGGKAPGRVGVLQNLKLGAREAVKVPGDLASAKLGAREAVKVSGDLASGRGASRPSS